MLHVIESNDGKPKLIVQASTHPGNLTEQQLTIKMAVDSEIRENGGVDFINLAYKLHENGFTIYGFREIQICN